MDYTKKATKQYLGYGIIVPRLLVAAMFAGAISACNLTSEHAADTGSAQSSNSIVTSINLPVTIDLVTRALAQRPTELTGSVVLAIESPPEHGAVQVLGDNQIVYTPALDYHGQDTFVYKLSDLNGPFEIGTVSIGILCDYCAPEQQVVKLSWNPLPDTSLIYMVYFGDSKTSATNIASETREASVELDVIADLGATSGDTVCFRLRARNDSGISGFSAPVCMVV